VPDSFWTVFSGNLVNAGRGLATDYRLGLRRLRDVPPLRVEEVDLHYDRRSPHMQRPRDALDVAVPDGPEEVGFRLNRARPSTGRQIQIGAEGAQGVGQRYESTAVQHSTRCAALPRPLQLPLYLFWGSGD
jgi:hypothetical protein